MEGKLQLEKFYDKALHPIKIRHYLIIFCRLVSFHDSISRSLLQGLLTVIGNRVSAYSLFFLHIPCVFSLLAFQEWVERKRPEEVIFTNDHRLVDLLLAME